jgi:hypothetical protein
VLYSKVMKQSIPHMCISSNLIILWKKSGAPTINFINVDSHKVLKYDLKRLLAFFHLSCTFYKMSFYKKVYLYNILELEVMDVSYTWPSTIHRCILYIAFNPSCIHASYTSHRRCMLLYHIRSHLTSNTEL